VSNRRNKRYKEAILTYFIMSDFFKMQKSPELIKKKWEVKLQQLKTKAELTHKQNILNLRKKLEQSQQQEFQKQVQKYEKRKNAYLKKKEQEYKRKCDNEIRILEGKPIKEPKHKKLTKNQKLQFALQIAQENAKLRDTNDKGQAHCISCWNFKEWEDLAWWHYESRQIQWICLRPENINAQCHKCNLVTWPLGNGHLKNQVQHYYKANLIEKYWEDRIQEMEEHKNKRITDPRKYSPTEPFLDEYIPDLILENERLRKTKTFQPAQRKNRRKLYIKYFNQDIH